MDNDIFARLAAPFPPEVVHWRIGSRSGDKASALAYIDARIVMDRLDTVVGPQNWQDKYADKGGGVTVCSLGINVTPTLASVERGPIATWVWKEDGAGTTQFEAEKGQISDAFKRAAVKWGIGRYLYSLPAPWVDLDDSGKRIAKHEMKRLNDELSKVSQGIEWGDRTDRNVYRILVEMMKEFDAGNLQAFIDTHAAMIKNLPVAMRRNLEQHVERIKELETA